uniref:Uncharacterized protein n=1 Tax=Plectus sambesii TaxID=2011161 RepID=A0A914V3Q5_9BILA
MLNWQGPLLADGVRETAQLDAQDLKKNTALHYAAASGLTRCVELLVSKGAHMTLENEAKESACDIAERFGFHDIAEFLETKMVFSSDAHPQDINEEDLFPVVQRFSGLREQDLMEAKDLLLVETSDMLQVPLFTAEAMLRTHEWSREALWLAWNRDPVACCEKSGVHAPVSAFESRASYSDSSSMKPVSASGRFPPASEAASSVKLTCEVCANEFDLMNDIVTNSECGHRFCKPCWK